MFVPMINHFDVRALDRARISRDPRFDGKFFIAVKTTGIYCRPICPSRTSNSRNVSYYPTAAAAAEAGFRPCLRCRPEAAPGTPAWMGTSAVVRKALRLIDEGKISGKQGKDVLVQMFKSGETAAAIVEKRGLVQVSDTGEIDRVIDEVLTANAAQVDQYRSGKEVLFGFFVGQVMKASKGKANPKVVNDRLREKLTGN